MSVVALIFFLSPQTIFKTIQYAYVFFFNYLNVFQNVKLLVESCLDRALPTQGSISFPTIGTGHCGYPPSDVAQLMLRTVKAYFESHSSGRLREVRIVIYHADDKTSQVNVAMRKQCNIFMCQVDEQG